MKKSNNKENVHRSAKHVKGKCVLVSVSRGEKEDYLKKVPTGNSTSRGELTKPKLNFSPSMDRNRSYFPTKESGLIRPPVKRNNSLGLVEFNINNGSATLFLNSSKVDLGKLPPTFIINQLKGLTSFYISEDVYDKLKNGTTTFDNLQEGIDWSNTNYFEVRETAIPVFIPVSPQVNADLDDVLPPVSPQVNAGPDDNVLPPVSPQVNAVLDNVLPPVSPQVNAVLDNVLPPVSPQVNAGPDDDELLYHHHESILKLLDELLHHQQSILAISSGTNFLAPVSPQVDFVANALAPISPQVNSGAKSLTPVLPAEEPEVVTSIYSTPVPQNDSFDSFNDPSLSVLGPLGSFFRTPFSPSNQGHIGLNGIVEYLESEDLLES